MKAFDLEAAKRGEPIQRERHNGEWQSVHFVGVKSNGLIVIEHTENGGITTYLREYLRMAPRKRTVWVTLFEDGSAGWMDEDVAIGRGNLTAIAEAIPIEIEE